MIGVTISLEIRNAGPVGVLTACAFVATTAIRMVAMWPVPNAMVENVEAFVDWHLAIVVEWLYWFVCTSSRVPGLILTNY
jgi:amino acid permease